MKVLICKDILIVFYELKIIRIEGNCIYLSDEEMFQKVELPANIMGVLHAGDTIKILCAAAPDATTIKEVLVVTKEERPLHTQSPFWYEVYTKMSELNM